MVTEGQIDTSRGMTPDEINGPTPLPSALRAAVGEPSGHARPGWVEVVQGAIAGLTAEREGFLWLEWADWLGVGIGLPRFGADQPVHPAAFVDLINRCPEISRRCMPMIATTPNGRSTLHSSTSSTTAWSTMSASPNSDARRSMRRSSQPGAARSISRCQQ